MLGSYSSSAPATPAFWALREHVAELRVVFVLVDVVDTDVPGGLVSRRVISITALYTPLQIVRPRVLVFAVWAEGTDVAG
jgi:hypothetical protein